jgi:DNA-binding transcriptional regulator of glucitol operon
MSDWSGILIALLVIVVVFAVAVGWWMGRRYRSARLQADARGTQYRAFFGRLRGSDPDGRTDIDDGGQGRRACDHA